jgi:hypothetical protein
MKHQPAPALAQMLAEDAERAIDVMAVEHVESEPSTFGPRLVIPPADYPPPTAHVDEDTETAPAKRGARRWSAEHMTPDFGGKR